MKGPLSHYSLKRALKHEELLTIMSLGVAVGWIDLPSLAASCILVYIKNIYISLHISSSQTSKRTLPLLVLLFF